MSNDLNKIVCITVTVSSQSLVARNSDGDVVVSYSISTAKNGIGQEMGSECTPLGEHKVRAKIGDGYQANTVFVARRATGEIYSEKLATEYPNRDWILTRILWLSGTEIGKNRLGDVDTMRRYIYIHGAPDSHKMGAPSSHGCIKMSNDDMIELFDKVDVGTTVVIEK